MPITKQVYEYFESVLTHIFLCLRVWKWWWNSKEFRRLTSIQTRQIVRSILVPVLTVVVPLNCIAVFHAFVMVAPLGLERLVPGAVTAAALREFVPVFTGLMLSFQTAARFAVEIAASRRSREIDAWIVMGVDPYQWMIGPTVLGMMWGAVIVSMLAAVLSLFSAAVGAAAFGTVTYAFYSEQMLRILDAYDVMVTTLKILVFTILSSGIALWAGFRVAPTHEGSGQASNQTVITSIVMTLIINYMINVLAYSGERGASLQ